MTEQEQPDFTRDQEVATHRPSEFYFRVAYRWAGTSEEREELFMAAIRNQERLKQWIIDTFGVPPPDFETTYWEQLEKHWLNPLACEDSRSLGAEESVPLPAEHPLGGGVAELA